MFTNETSDVGQFAPHLPDTAYVRIKSIVGGNGTLGVLPISRSAFYKGIKDGRFKAPTKLGPKMSGWTVGYVRQLLAAIAAGEFHV